MSFRWLQASREGRAGPGPSLKMKFAGGGVKGGEEEVVDEIYGQS